MDEMRYQLDYLQAMNKKLTSEKDAFAQIINSSMNGIVYYSYENGTVTLYGNCEHFFGKTSVESLRDLYDLLDHTNSLPGSELNKLVYLERYELESFESEFEINNGIWTFVSSIIIKDESGNDKAKLIKFYDQTKLHKQNQELISVAYYDKLTGMFNRDYFVSKLSQWVNRAAEEGKNITVANFDIDDFRKINDGLSIVVGDELICEFGKFLSSICNGENIMCSRFTGDQFYVAIFDPVGRRNIGYIHELIRERLESPFRLTDVVLNITVSVGVADYPEAGETALELVNNAEIVMFRAKSNGKGAIRYYDRSIIERFHAEVIMENKLKEAYKRDEFVLFYQPQYDAVTQKLRGLEALVRWPKPEGGMVSPGEFIPVAESSGLIVQIGEQIMDKAMKAMAEWKSIYHTPFYMCINVSAIQFKNEYFQSKVQGLIHKYHLEPSEIELELTESVLADDFDAMMRKLMALKSFGIRISIDDFGTGYSSLSYLKKLPVETLKIDKSFVDNMIEGSKDGIIMSSILTMTKQLGFETIAEGVEYKEQMDSLRNQGCDVIQGFLLGRPMPGEDIEKLLTSLEEKNEGYTVERANSLF